MRTTMLMTWRQPSRTAPHDDVGDPAADEATKEAPATEAVLSKSTWPECQLFDEHHRRLRLREARDEPTAPLVATCERSLHTPTASSGQAGKGPVYLRYKEA